MVQKIGTAAYRLELPPGAQIHPIFHVSVLKKAAKGVNVSTELPQVSDEGITKVAPVSVLERRQIKHG